MSVVKSISVSVVIFLAALAAPAQDTGSVKGIVRSDSGDKLAGVSIIARREGKDLGSTVSGKGGEFRLSGLDPGVYNLVFEKDGFSSGVLFGVLVKKKKVNNLSDRLIMTIDEGTLVIVSGSVFNQYGRSIYGAKVKIEEILPDQDSRRDSTIYTSRSGQFTFRFEEGKRTLRVTVSVKDVVGTKEIEVDDAGIYRLALTLNLPEKTS